MPIESGYHSRGYLPHIKVSGAAYFVTFRLADSLPRDVVVRLKERRDDLLARIAHEKSTDAERRRRESFARYASEVDAVLDQHTGASWLRDAQIAVLVSRAVMHFNEERYRLHAWCVMPNHVHAVVRPVGRHTLDSILHSWKSYTATAANKTLQRIGKPFWQHETYDHWIRDDADLAHCVRYTEQNPVKAGLCERPEAWPWSSADLK